MPEGTREPFKHLTASNESPTAQSCTESLLAEVMQRDVALKTFRWEV
jgi:hypothetical protein